VKIRESDPAGEIEAPRLYERSVRKERREDKPRKIRNAY